MKRFNCPLQLWLKIYERTGSRGLSSKPNPLGWTRHDNLQWRHDWSREEPARFPPLSALWNSESNQCNSFTMILLFCLKLIQNRRTLQWYKNNIYVTFDTSQWMRELKPSFVTLSTFWSARQTTKCLIGFLFWVLVRLLFILLLPDFHWFYVFRLVY